MDYKPFTILVAMSLLLVLFSGCANQEVQVTSTTRGVSTTAQPPTTEAIATSAALPTTVKATTSTKKVVSTSVVSSTSPHEEYRPEIDPNDYVSGVNNPYFILRPGYTYFYEGTLDNEVRRVEVYVTNDVKKILGITAMQVRERVYVKAKLKEETMYYYSQDMDGNVWYFGKDRKEYQNGRISGDKGSWETGVNGARPGIIMLGDTSPSDPYRQVYVAGEIEGMGQVIKTGEAASTPSGTYPDVIIVKEWTQLAPGAVTWKYYARDVGMIFEVRKEGGSGEIDLMEIKKG
jgi:hypothetical protein